MRCPSQDAIQKPDDETIYHQDYERDDARRVPQMPRLQRNQRSGGENHEQFSPTFLQINANAFGKENGGIEKCEQGRSAKIPAFDHVLKLVQEVNNRPTVQQEKFVLVQSEIASSQPALLLIKSSEKPRTRRRRP